jgi:hypothetical protein
MTDLIPRDLMTLTNGRLVLILCNRKREMVGELKVLGTKKVDKAADSIPQ